MNAFSESFASLNLGIKSIQSSDWYQKMELVGGMLLAVAAFFGAPILFHGPKDRFLWDSLLFGYRAGAVVITLFVIALVAKWAWWIVKEEAEQAPLRRLPQAIGSAALFSVILAVLLVGVPVLLVNISFPQVEVMKELLVWEVVIAGGLVSLLVMACAWRVFRHYPVHIIAILVGIAVIRIW